MFDQDLEKMKTGDLEAMALVVLETLAARYRSPTRIIGLLELWKFNHFSFLKEQEEIEMEDDKK